MEAEALEKAVEKFGMDTVAAIGAALRSVGADNTGELINSLRSELRDTGEGLEMMIKAKGYFFVVENGRRPGKQPPLAEIVKWTQSRGLPEKAAFPIARNIGKFGIKPRPVLKQIVESNEFKEGFRNISEAYAKDMTKEINNIIKETNIT